MNKLLLLSVSVLLIILLSVNSFAFLWGDLDGDAQITVNDARKALRISADIEKYNMNDLNIRSIDIDNSYTISINEVTQLLKIAANISVRTELSNKKIVNFGDSIFGNYRDTSENDKSISKMISEQTGAICYNFGFGGCRMATHSNYWDAFSMHSLADSIASDDWNTQEQALFSGVQTLPSYFAETIDCLKNIDWNEIDYITIGYGTNDYSGNVFLHGTEHSFTNEWDSFKGALRYSVRKIQNAYPNIQIVIITPMWRYFINNDVYAYSSDDPVSANTRGYLLPEYVSACFEISEEFGIPCIDTYDTLKIDETNYYHYFNEWDGTHPNVTGRQLRANTISNALLDFERKKTH